MKSLKYLALLGLFVSVQAFGLKADINTVKAYHNDEINQLLTDYTLEDSLNIRVELKRKDTKLTEQEIVSIPGLYQKTGEFSEVDLGKVLNLYDRKIVLIQKRQVSNEEMDLVKSSLKDRLYLPEDVQYTVLDDTPKIQEAVSNISNDFFFGAYVTLIKKGQFLWILIFSIGFIIALYVLAKVWKGKSQGADAGGSSELSMSGGGLEASNDKISDKNDDNTHGAQGGFTESDLETFNFKSLCSNLTEAYAQSPGSTSQVLWQQIPDFKSQIQFYEIIKIQKDISDNVYQILDSIFSFKSRSNSASNLRSQGFSKHTLSNISVELAKIKFSDVHNEHEEVLSEIYPNCADHKSELYEKGLETHYLVLYKIFKDDFMNYLSTSKNSNIMDKVNDLLTFDPSSDHPESSKYKAFVSFLKESNFGVKDKSQKTVNNKVVQMLYNLSEDDLSNVKALKESDELKSLVPRLSWVNSEDSNRLKSFLTNLDGHQLKLFLDEESTYSSAISELDDRTKFRLTEKASKGDQEKIDWTSLREKIKLFYSYESDKGNEQHYEKKAS